MSLTSSSRSFFGIYSTTLVHSHRRERVTFQREGRSFTQERVGFEDKEETLLSRNGDVCPVRVSPRPVCLTGVSVQSFDPSDPAGIVPDRRVVGLTD